MRIECFQSLAGEEQIVDVDFVHWHPGIGFKALIPLTYSNRECVGGTGAFPFLFGDTKATSCRIRARLKCQIHVLRLMTPVHRKILH